MLNAFCSFMDKHLLPSSVEKRSVALKLSVELVRALISVFAAFYITVSFVSSLAIHRYLLLLNY
jgi:hypothetical protein